MSAPVPHTEGRIQFRANGDANSYALLDSEGHWLLSLLHNGEKLTATQEANLRRLVACWNVLEGLPTELLERHKATRSGIYKGTEALKQQRDELLAALEMGTSIEHTLPGGAQCQCGQCRFVRAKRSAIAKATSQEGGSHG